MKFTKGTKIITVKGTSKRVTHKRKVKISDKKGIKKEIISLNYEESINNYR